MKNLKMRQSERKIRMLVMDVDGTLTDGSIYVSTSGEAVKAFHVKDGYGIKNRLPVHDILPVIITGRQSTILQIRAEELGIEYLFQGVEDKRQILRDLAEKLGVAYTEIACIGDDLNDMPMMELCGVVGCPCDAIKEVKRRSHFISEYAGGRGAVRDFIEWLIEKEEK